MNILLYYIFLFITTSRLVRRLMELLPAWVMLYPPYIFLGGKLQHGPLGTPLHLHWSALCSIDWAERGDHTCIICGSLQSSVYHAFMISDRFVMNLDSCAMMVMTSIISIIQFVATWIVAFLWLFSDLWRSSGPYKQDCRLHYCWFCMIWIRFICAISFYAQAVLSKSPHNASYFISCIQIKIIWSRIEVGGTIGWHFQTLPTLVSAAKAYDGLRSGTFARSTTKRCLLHMALGLQIHFLKTRNEVRANISHIARTGLMYFGYILDAVIGHW